MGGLDETHGGLKKRHISRNSWETIAEDVVTGLLVVRLHKSFLRSALFEEQPKSGNHFAKIFGNLFRPKSRNHVGRRLQRLVIRRNY